MINKFNQWLYAWQVKRHEKRVLKNIIRDKKNSDNITRDRTYLEMQSLWNDLDLLKGIDFPARKEARDSWCTIPYKINKQRLFLNACAISCILIMSVLIWRADPWPEHENTYENLTNKRNHLVLSDGSEIYMNVATRLQVKFYRTRREILLNSGEAFFKVHHDPEKPFIVITENSKARAVGTAFNVYKKTDEVEIAVAEGIVEVIISDEQEKVLLHKGESLLHNNLRLVSLDNVYPDTVAMWREGKIFFDETSLNEVIYKLKRYGFDVPVSLDNEVATLKLSGSYRINQPRNLLLTLSQVLPVTILEQNNHILITSRD